MMKNKAIWLTKKLTYICEDIPMNTSCMEMQQYGNYSKEYDYKPGL